VSNRLYRSDDDRIIAGVAGGIAETYDLDPALVRVVWALLILVTGGVFLLLYIIMAIVVPLRPYPTYGWGTAPASGAGGTGDAPAQGTGGGGVPPGPTGPATDMSAPTGSDAYGRWYDRQSRREYRRYRRHDGSGALILGAFLIVIGAYFLIRQFVPALNVDLFWPLLIVFVGVLVIVAAYARPRGDM